jgi:putative membrane protein
VRQLLRWVVLLLPVLAAAVFSPDALSSTTFANRAALNSTAGVAAMPSMSAASQEDVKNALSADPSQPVPVEVTDLITLAKSPAQMQSFTGRKVTSVGFIIRQPGSAPKLLRWMMWCCAADAQPVSVALDGKVDGDYKDSDWYQVTGTAEFPSTLGQVTPHIDVDSIKPANEPDEPYLSP